MRSWRTTRRCSTCLSPLKLRTQRKTHLAPRLMPQAWLEPLTMHQPAETKSRGSRLLRWAQPRKRLALPPLNSRGCQVTVSCTAGRQVPAHARMWASVFTREQIINTHEHLHKRATLLWNDNKIFKSSRRSLSCVVLFLCLNTCSR